jgi:hypothetical protein
MLVLSSLLVLNEAKPYRSDGSGSYSPSRALLFAHFSNAAYCSAANISYWDCAPCRAADKDFVVSKVVSGGGMQGFVGQAPGNDIVVSFRGSDNIRNWIDNIDITKTDAYPKCDGCRVHTGFYKAWNSVKDDVVKEVQRLHEANSSANIFVTGHSLGAAVAALCAVELGASSQSLSFPIAGVYTYGEPRVGNDQFAKFYMTGTQVSWRVTHWRDIVPHLPPEAFGFHHTATEVWYTEDQKNYTVCDGSGEDPTCADQLFEAVSIDDHLQYMGIAIAEC